MMNTGIYQIRNSENGRCYIGSTEGGNHPKAKLSNHEMREIRGRLMNGVASKELARQFNVSSSTVTRIKHRRIPYEEASGTAGEG